MSDATVSVKDKEVAVTTANAPSVVQVTENNYAVVIEPSISYISEIEREVVAIDKPEVTSVIEQGQQGPQGIPGPAGAAVLTAIADATVNGHRAVIMSNQNKVSHGDNEDLAHVGRVIGISTGAAMMGDSVLVRTFGEMSEPSWVWTPGQAVYVGSDGVLVQSPPVFPALFSQIVGFATSPTSLYIDVCEPTILN